MDFLSKLADTTLEKVIKSHEKDFFEYENRNRAQILQKLKEIALHFGIKEVTRGFAKEQLLEICKEEGMELNEHGKSHYCTLVINEIATKTPKIWFKKCKENTLKLFVNLHFIQEKTRNAAVGRLIDKINDFGLQLMFSDIDTINLHVICEDLAINDHEATNNRNILINCIIHQQPVDLSLVRREKPINKIPPKKPIVQCTTYNQIFQHYFRSDMEEFCRDRGLSPNGSKKAIINRILKYLAEHPNPSPTVDKTPTKNISNLHHLFPSLDPCKIPTLNSPHDNESDEDKSKKINNNNNNNNHDNKTNKNRKNESNNIKEESTEDKIVKQNIIKKKGSVATSPKQKRRSRKSQ